MKTWQRPVAPSASLAIARSSSTPCESKVVAETLAEIVVGDLARVAAPPAREDAAMVRHRTARDLDRRAHGVVEASQVGRGRSASSRLDEAEVAVHLVGVLGDDVEHRVADAGHVAGRSGRASLARTRAWADLSLSERRTSGRKVATYDLRPPNPYRLGRGVVPTAYRSPSPGPRRRDLRRPRRDRRRRLEPTTARAALVDLGPRRRVHHAPAAKITGRSRRCHDETSRRRRSRLRHDPRRRPRGASRSPSPACSTTAAWASTARRSSTRRRRPTPSPPPSSSTPTRDGRSRAGRALLQGHLPGQPRRCQPPRRVLELARRADVDLGNGQRTVSFAPTMKMSTYLVAFVVGPFEETPASTSTACRSHRLPPARDT